MLGLNRHMPPFVVTHCTLGALEGYSAVGQWDGRSGGMKQVDLTSVEADRKLFHGVSANLAREKTEKEKVRYLKEAKLVRRLVWTDDQGLDIANVDVAAGDGDGYREAWSEAQGTPSPD